MTKVTMREGPAPQREPQKAAGAGEVVVKDARGRMLTLRKPPLIAEFRMAEAAGASSSNQAYMNMLMPLIYLAAIDGQPVEQPRTKREVEALIALADHDGYAAVMRGIKEHFPEQNPDIAELIKNVDGTLG
jgi:hypothetical protein